MRFSGNVDNGKQYLIGELLKHIFFRNPRITEVLAVERDVKPRNINFAKIDRMGWVINREGVFVWINTVYVLPKLILKQYLIGELLKHIFFRNPRITEVLAVERDVKPRNINFAKIDRMGWVINREGVFVWINTVYVLPKLILKQYLIGELLKHIFFRNPRITEVLAVERDVKPRNINFAKIDRMGWVINRKGAFVWINTVYVLPKLILE